jgi:hypothetical protein
MRERRLCSLNLEMDEKTVTDLIPDAVYRSLVELDAELPDFMATVMDEGVLDGPAEFWRRVVQESDEPAFYHRYRYERPGQLPMADVVVDMRQAATAAENIAFASAVSPVPLVPVAPMPPAKRRRIEPYRPW